ncbi:ABC transporter ATP-binding protein [Halobacteriaceae archaeon SHR40]|uniref:ABC transporter ATP-binding protein n=1 Tax=Halovenus amylolytica TaxID=2500550 RepID=UPI000FE37E8F
MDENLSWTKQIRTLLDVARYRPLMTAIVVVLNLVLASLEGIGLGFILPIIEAAEGSDGPSGDSRLLGVFQQLYEFLGVPFTMEYLIVGVLLIITVRYATSFVAMWAAVILRTSYVKDMRTRAFESTLNAEVSYFDTKGSEEMLNAIITQTKYAGRTITHLIRTLNLTLMCTVYLLIALLVAPFLMLTTGIVLVVFMFGVRYILESGFSIGERVAEANELVQESVQAGTEGIRDIKLFGLNSEVFEKFQTAMDQYVTGTISQERNKALINSTSQFATAVALFGLIYIGTQLASLTLGGLGLFLFAVFRLGPKLSQLNDVFYQAQSTLPHLVRTQEFVTELKQVQEPTGSESVPSPIRETRFEDVEFSYDAGDEQVLQGVSFDIQRGNFAAFVGPSGAGKSTIVSLLARMYEPDGGQITADGTEISQYDIGDWRSRISVVRQDPFIFNETLRYNVTIGNRDATDRKVRQVCEIAEVTEFLDELPEGFDTMLGEEGVRLSGGQRQRVAIARALLKDADLLILDEATSDLDSHLEERVHSGIEAMERDYAMIAIAHRLSTVTDADCIYMMEDGEIVESGTHRELLNKQGEYSALYATQSKEIDAAWTED